ncbi:MAG TPA: ROK family protein [Actinophytocola sp.]|uniref:ROK family protein n=1 Tax=Actinophytocola sp. TaxID=1872138 RepID=UPI002E00B787|nr:ROK family protein [Actinophytocola sp.]
MISYALALDVGGTTIAAAVIDSAGQILTCDEVVTPPADAATIAAAVRGVAASVLAAAPPGALAGVGIGSAGPLDPVAGTVSPVNITVWRDFPLVAEVRPIAAGTPVSLAGDAICMALGEHWRGGHGGRTLLGIVVSTGVGSGLIINGTAFQGPTGNAGHFGHTVVQLDGPACPCGARGCVEALSSGPAMTTWALTHGWRPTAPPDARTLATAARSGDPIALRAFDRGARALAAGIASAAAMVDLDTVVIGGGVAAAGPVLFNPIHTALTDYAALPFIRRVHIAPSPLGRRAGLYGAAALAFTTAAQPHLVTQP